MPLMCMNYESTPTDGKVRCQPSRKNWGMQKNKLFACFCSCKYHRKNLHDPHHHGQVWVPSRLEQSCRQAVFPLSALACSLKTRFQLLVPVPTQTPPNFKVVIEFLYPHNGKTAYAPCSHCFWTGMERNGPKMPIFGQKLPKMQILDQIWSFLGQKS